MDFHLKAVMELCRNENKTKNLIGIFIACMILINCYFDLQQVKETISVAFLLQKMSTKRRNDRGLRSGLTIDENAV